ncbi:MAG TPA: glutamine amidotransferase, partial [Gemmataceae bacterium]|nr:glutamine amidotransferase [Gemmataceae bacterium]
NATFLLLASFRFDNVSARWGWLWIVLAVAGAVVLFLTYRGIFQRSERRLTWALMALRAVGLLLLLLALAKPTWTSETDAVDPGHLGVVLDNSLSMSLPDASGKPRYAVARAALERLKQALANDRSGKPLKVDLFDINGNPLADVPEQPTVERTDLARAVSESTSKLRSKPLAGMVVISDGMDNTGREAFRELADTPVPVHAVGFRPADDATGFDLAVKKVKAPERAMVNNEIKVEVLVSKAGSPATDATVVVKRGRDTFAEQKVAFAAGSGEQKVALRLTPRQAGNFVFTAEVKGGAGERVLANNFAHFPLRVDVEPIRILYLEGFLRYEYKFLKNRLEDDPDVNLVSVVRRVNPEQAGPQAGKDLVTPERLKNFDIVILGDMEASYLVAPEYQALVRWLDEKNHSLLVLGGYHSFGADGFRSTPLADVLPVVFADKPPYQSEEPFTLQLKRADHPIFEISGDHVKDAAAWEKAPPLLGCSLVQRAKPGAEVLAVDPGLLVEGEPAVVAAVQRSGGGGQVMVLTADTTWRWSRLPRVLGQADTLYARFWSQAVRFLAGRSKNDQRPLLVVSTDRPDYEVGKPVTVRVVRQPRPDNDLSGMDLNVEVTGPAGKAKPVEVRAGSAEPDVFTGTYYPEGGGRYEVAASLTGGGKPPEHQVAEFLVQGSDLELADTGTNRENLKAIAAATGGVYVDAEDAQQLADKVPHTERKLPQVRRVEF